MIRFSVGGALDQYRDWEAETADEPPTPIPDEVEGRDMLYSSGTTGRPKGVKIPYVERAIGSPDAVTGLTKAGLSHLPHFLHPAHIVTTVIHAGHVVRVLPSLVHTGHIAHIMPAVIHAAHAHVSMAQ